MKRSLLLLYMFMLCATSLSGQDAPGFQKELKINIPFRISAGQWQQESLAPVLLLETKRRHRHEFEMSRLGFFRWQEPQIDELGQHYRNFRADHGLGLRYQYTYSFLPDARFSPFLGGSVQSRWSYYSFASERRRFFNYAHHSNINTLELVPGIRIRITERIGIDYGLGFSLLQHSYRYSRFNSLALGSWRYGIYELESAPFNYVQNRIGLYIRL